MEEYSDFYNLRGDWFNIEAVCPYYDPENQHAFTWRRDKNGIAIVSGYDPENDPTTDWLCWCGHYETGGGRCTNCGNDAPWGADSYDDKEEYDEDLDFGFDYALGYQDDLDFGFPDYDAEVGDWTEGVPD